MSDTDATPTKRARCCACQHVFDVIRWRYHVCPNCGINIEVDYNEEETVRTTLAETEESKAGIIPDLTLVDTEDMLVELMGRFDHAAFVALKDSYKGEEEHFIKRKWKGNTHTACGLCDDLKIIMLDALHSDSVSIGEEKYDCEICGGRLALINRSGWCYVCSKCDREFSIDRVEGGEEYDEHESSS